jgi:hypothetical protein
MRQKDQARKRTLRLALAAITNAKVAKGNELDDGEVLAVLAKQAKQSQEALEEFRKAGREDLVAREEADLAVLQAYLPRQLDRDEIAKRAQAAIEGRGASSMRDMGSVMKALMADLRGQADGKLVNQIVRELLGRRE